MKKITEQHFCDYCGVEIDSHAPVAIYSPVKLAGQHEGEAFSYRVGTGGYTYKESEFCTPLCCVLDFANRMGVKPTEYSDEELTVFRNARQSGKSLTMAGLK